MKTQINPTVNKWLPARSWKTAFLLWLAGLSGVISLYLTDIPMPSEVIAAGLTKESFKLSTMIGPFLMLGIAVVLGRFLAHKTGLQVQRFGDSASGLKGLLFISGKTALGVGLVLAALYFLLGLLIPDESLAAVKAFERDALHPATALIYGSITEEIVMRWGLFSLVLWITWMFAGRPEKMSNTAAYAAIIGMAVLTMLSHLPTPFQILGDPPAALLVQQALSGTISAAAAGWLCFRHGLESAMVYKFFLVTGALTVLHVG